MKPGGESEGIKIIAGEVGNPDNKGENEPDIDGRFPGVVCFYRSQNQRNGAYGKEEGEGYIPNFGFDTYIPRLMGVDSKIKKSYQTSGNAVTGFEAKTSSKKTKEIIIYPDEKELVYNTSKAETFDPLYKKEKQEKKYFIPWLYLKDNDTIQLQVNVLFHSYLHKTDDFKVHKKKDKTEEIRFKLVKVDNDWSPIKRIKDSKEIQVYEDIKESRVFTDAQKTRRDEMPARENELKQEESDLKQENDQWDTDYKKYENRESQYENEREPYNKKVIDFNKDQAYYNARVREKNGKATLEDKELLKADKVKYNKFSFSKASKDLNTDFKTIESEDQNRKKEKSDLEISITNLNQSKKEIEAKKLALAAKKKTYEKDKTEIEEENRKYQSDGTLEVSKKPFKFEFESTVTDPAAPNPCHASLSIQRKGNNKKAALIAYYVRLDKASIEKEYIIGQVNILDCEFYKENNSQNIEKIYFNPMPVHLVQVMIKKDDKPAKEWNLSKPAKDMVNQLNPYFTPIGISFFSTQRTSKIEVEMKKVDGKYKLIVDGIKFDTNNSEYLADSKTKEDVKLKDQLNKLLKAYLLSELFYDTYYGNNKEKLRNIDLLKKHTYTADKDKEKPIPISALYEGLLNKLPKLQPADKNDMKSKWETALSLTDYLIKNTNVVYMFNDISGEGESSARTSAYAMVGDNGVVIYKTGLDKWVSTMIHEIGHTLDLQHTFLLDYPMYPEQVSFDTDKWKNKINGVNGDDSLAHGATYDNIMDYEGLPDNSTTQTMNGAVSSLGNTQSAHDRTNGSYIRRSFTKRQWEKMYTNLWEKSYEATKAKGYEGALLENHPYLSTEEDIDKFIQELKTFL